MFPKTAGEAEVPLPGVDRRGPLTHFCLSQPNVPKDCPSSLLIWIHNMFTFCVSWIRVSVIYSSNPTLVKQFNLNLCVVTSRETFIINITSNTFPIHFAQQLGTTHDPQNISTTTSFSLLLVSIIWLINSSGFSHGCLPFCVGVCFKFQVLLYGLSAVKLKIIRNASYSCLILS